MKKYTVLSIGILMYSIGYSNSMILPRLSDYAASNEIVFKEITTEPQKESKDKSPKKKKHVRFSLPADHKEKIRYELPEIKYEERHAPVKPKYQDEEKLKMYFDFLDDKDQYLKTATIYVLLEPSYIPLDQESLDEAWQQLPKELQVRAKNYKLFK